MTYYVAVDIGCIECGEATAVLGVFTTDAAAKETCADHDERHAANWHGQHYFDVFEVPDLDRVNRVEYP